MIDPMLILYFIVAVVVLAVIYILWNFPWLIRYYTPIMHKEKILGSKIIVVSDIHLREGSIPRALSDFIKKEGAEILVVAGDLFEYRHRKISRDRLEAKLAEIFGPIFKSAFPRQIFYVTSTSSHDPKIENVEEFMISGKKIVVIPGVLILEDSSMYYVTHGDYASRNGVIARTLNRIFRFWTERKLRKVLKLPDDAWLICGHTHLPGIDRNCRIANTGSWKGKISVKPTYTAVIVDTEKDHVEIENVL